MEETQEPEVTAPETVGVSLKLRLGLIAVCVVGVAGSLGVACHLWLEGHIPLVAYVFGFFLPTLLITSLLSRYLV